MVTLAGLVPVAPGMPMGPGPLMFMLVTCHGWRVGVGVAEVRPARAGANRRTELRCGLNSILATGWDGLGKDILRLAGKRC